MHTDTQKIQNNTYKIARNERLTELLGVTRTRRFFFFIFFFKSLKFSILSIRIKPRFRLIILILIFIGSKNLKSDLNVHIAVVCKLSLSLCSFLNSFMGWEINLIRLDQYFFLPRKFSPVYLVIVIGNCYCLCLRCNWLI